MIDAPVEDPLDRARMVTQAVSFVLVVSLSVLFGCGGWLALVSALLATGVLLLGVANVEQLVVGWLTRPSSGASWLHVPLTDTTLNMDALNRLANSCQRGRPSTQAARCVCRPTAGASPGLAARRPWRAAGRK